MSLFSGIASGYKRWRHRRGYGVHSPFAYRFVKDVVTGGGHYYAVVRYRRHVAPLPVRTRREYGLLFRLVARLAPRQIFLAGSVEMQLRPLLYLADSRPKVAETVGPYLSTAGNALTILSSTDLRSAIPAGILRSGNIVVVRELHDAPRVLPELLQTMKGGWVFADSRMAIAVSDDREPLNYIEVKLT